MIELMSAAPVISQLSASGCGTHLGPGTRSVDKLQVHEKCLFLFTLIVCGISYVMVMYRVSKKKEEDYSMTLRH